MKDVTLRHIVDSWNDRVALFQAPYNRLKRLEGELLDYRFIHYNGALDYPYTYHVDDYNRTENEEFLKILFELKSNIHFYEE